MSLMDSRVGRVENSPFEPDIQLSSPQLEAVLKLVGDAPDIDERGDRIRWRMRYERAKGIASLVLPLDYVLLTEEETASVDSSVSKIMQPKNSNQEYDDASSRYNRELTHLQRSMSLRIAQETEVKIVASVLRGFESTDLTGLIRAASLVAINSAANTIMAPEVQP